jgi:glutamate/tyrosine decarboxylase-like PLP-dependent enzyme/2-polyprenyl-6-methoxyphenol hydroxylase-like FAD-dependent oxidoreductase
MKAIIVGAGPVGCLLAVGLRQRLFDVEVYDRRDDLRRTAPACRHSFNLTLSSRGLTALGPELASQQYRQGLPLSVRVRHHADGSLSAEPYGITREHHLLSVRRSALHASLVDAAERAGARVRFGHECLTIDAARACATFAGPDGVTEAAADLLAGCDGVRSVVRETLVRDIDLVRLNERIPHGYIELELPATAGRSHSLTLMARSIVPDAQSHALHIWPRGSFLLIAQPNPDESYSATLFLPFDRSLTSGPSFEQLTGFDRLEEFFRTHFHDVVDCLPPTAPDVRVARPGSLRTRVCRTFHHGRTVVLGDAAHTLLPFYGQGINCGFEDVQILLELLDRRLKSGGSGDAIPASLAEFSERRRGPCHAIAELSRARFHELMADYPDENAAKADLERALHARDRHAFVPLYCSVAFTTKPYDEAIAEYESRRMALDELCRRFDPRADQDAIVEEYLGAAASARACLEPRDGLQLPPAARQRLLELTVASILRHEDEITGGRYPASYVHDSVNVAAYTDGKRLSASLREDEVPTAGTDIESILAVAFDAAVAGGTLHPHPGFMAHVPSGGLLQGATGEFIAAALNRFAGVWIAAPGLIQLESNVIRWFCTILGYGAGSFGYLTTSGSMANMMGLMCACRSKRAGPGALLTIYTSSEAHYSVRKAARLIGIADSRIRVVPAGADLSMTAEALTAAMDSDRTLGTTPACVVATAGTTNTGAIDDLSGIAEVCQHRGIWLHTDACLGGFFRLTERGRSALAGVERSDSIAVDAHKSLFLPHGNSALLVRQRAQLAATFEVPDAPYLPGASDEGDVVDFCSYGPELSRSIRGLSAWIPIKMHGIGAFAQTLNRTMDLAVYLSRELDRIAGIEVLRCHTLRLPIVVFRHRAPAGDPDEVNRRLCQRICEGGRVYLTTTELHGRGTVLRACILNHRTDRARVDQLVADVRAALETM